MSNLRLYSPFPMFFKGLSITLLFLLFGNFLFAQSDTLADKELISIFRKIIRTDQKYVRNNTKRDPIILRNFDIIVSITEKQGFPQLRQEYRSKKKNNLISQGAFLTFIHVLQTKPEDLLNESIINLFKTEISSGRLEKSILRNAMNIYLKTAYDKPWLIDNKDLFDFAYREWDLGNAE